jgi:hypothetical protein
VSFAYEPLRSECKQSSRKGQRASFDLSGAYKLFGEVDEQPKYERRPSGPALLCLNVHRAIPRELRRDRLRHKWVTSLPQLLRTIAASRRPDEWPRLLVPCARNGVAYLGATQAARSRSHHPIIHNPDTRPAHTVPAMLNSRICPNTSSTLASKSPLAYWSRVEASRYLCHKQLKSVFIGRGWTAR